MHNLAQVVSIWREVYNQKLVNIFSQNFPHMLTSLLAHMRV